MASYDYCSFGCGEDKERKREIYAIRNERQERVADRHIAARRIMARHGTALGERDRHEYRHVFRL
jgi:hypothetical protein